MKRRQSLDSLRDAMAEISPYDKQKKKNPPLPLGSYDEPISPCYHDIPIRAFRYHGEVQRRVESSRDNALSQLFRFGPIQLKLFQYLCPRDIMVLVSTDAPTRRRIREVLSAQNPPADANEPISVQDLRPWPYHPHGLCDCDVGYDTSAKIPSLFSWHTATFDRCMSLLFSNQHPPLDSLKVKDVLLNIIFSHISRPKPGSWTFFNNYPKFQNSDFTFYCRKREHVPQYDSVGNLMVSCCHCRWRAEGVLGLYITSRLWKPVCRPCDRKARSLYPRGYHSCHCEDGMVEETCHACFARQLNKYEERHNIRQRCLAWNQKTSSTNVIGKTAMAVIKSPQDFVRHPKQSIQQLKDILKARLSQGDQSYDRPNLVCACGAVITTIGNDMWETMGEAYDVVHPGISDKSKRRLVREAKFHEEMFVADGDTRCKHSHVIPWTRFCIACEGVMVPDSTGDYGEKGEGNAIFRDALGMKPGGSIWG